MGRKPYIESAKGSIEEYILGQEKSVFKLHDLENIFQSKRDDWGLASNTTLKKFIDQLIDWGFLQRHVFKFKSAGYENKTLYSISGCPVELIANHVYPRQYFGYYSAMYYHNLTEQLPEKHYLVSESTHKSNGSIGSQLAIDKAFSKEPRVTDKVAVVQGTPDKHFCFISGVDSQLLGVIKVSDFTNGTTRVSNLERTLLDVMVRPEYSGGVWEVLRAFDAAKDIVSINRLLAFLKKLNYLYPFHQRLGFYLSRCNYEPSQINLVDQLEKPWNFYLSHGLQEIEFDKQWKIYHPKGM